MTDLFRFVALRAAARTAPNQAIDLSTESPFQKELAGVRRTDNPIEAARQIVQLFIKGAYGPGYIADISGVPYHDAFDQLAVAAAMAQHAAEVAAAITADFGMSAQALVADSQFTQLEQEVRDTIVAVFLLPAARSIPLADLALLARLVGLIRRVAASDTSLDEPGAIQRALSETLLLPPAVFPLRTDLPQPVGVGDLLVVKQQLKRYEPGDIANIENILHGEKREKVSQHNLTFDTTVVTETAKTTETTTSLDVTERFELKTEVDNTVQEDLATNAGVNVSAKYGGVEINANANVAYTLSKEQSTKAATDHAKDVVSRAATKVTETVRRQETTRTIEILKQREAHSFENTAADSPNVSGVYQWLNKVYEAQVFNYGRRLMFDLMIPEPAAFIRDAVITTSQQDAFLPPEPFAVVHDPTKTPPWRPIEPADLGADGLLKTAVVARPLTPADLAPDNGAALYYGNFMGKFGAVGVNAPPELITTVSKGLTANKDDHDHLTLVDDLTIPQGYRASAIDVQGAFALYEQEDGDETMVVFVGKNRYQARGNGTLNPALALVPGSGIGTIDEQGTIPIAVETQQARDVAITVDVTCTLTEAALDQWRLDTYVALVNAHANLVGVYQDKLKARAVQAATVTSLGQNPTQNRLIERTELKKACISRLAATDLYLANFDDISVNGTAPAFPRPSVPTQPNSNIVGSDQAAFIRFFEQAFEWEHMMYVFYPYYWARRDTWYTSAVADNPDPLFAEFLKAGAARVVVPVRLQLEGDVRYFLMTGAIWGGGAMPEITDADYLPITEEIRDRDDAPGNEVPQGDPWEVSLPTTLIQLRADETLPSWNKYTVDGHDVWVPGRLKQGKWVPDYGTLDASGHWTP